MHMKIQYISDLHLEFEESREFLQEHPIIPLGDILVIAGDAIYLGDGEMTRLDFFDWCADHFEQTLIVPGNHEFYRGFDIIGTLEGFELELRPNVRYLNNRSWRSGDVELFFTTLWQQYSTVEKLTAQTLLNDYGLCKLDGVPLEAFSVNRIHKACTDWLAGALDGSDAAHKVVVTHHCPIREEGLVAGIGKKLGKPYVPCYMTDMTDFILEHRPEYWIHGHVHEFQTMGSRVGRTTVYSNPLGYVFEDESKSFSPTSIISQ